MSIFHHLQREMAAVGYERTVEQINNKLKKLKKKYRDQKKNGRNGNRWTRKNPQFGMLDSVLGGRLANNISGALNSATAVVYETLPKPDPELCAIEEEEEEEEEDPTPPLHCTSPAPSSSSRQSQQNRLAKRKRDSNAELLDYLERSDERFLQHSKEMNDALLHKLEANTSAFLSLMGRMVSVIEAQAKK